jgi:hypothetical protein
MLRAPALSLLCVLAALTFAACGESGSPGGDSDPASLVPAGAPVYLQAAVQPQGERRDDALAAAGKIMRTGDPAAKLRELVDKGLADDGLTWERDFAPWLGEDAGIWATNFQADEPSYAAIVATKDVDAAKAALAKFEKTSDSGPYTARTYKGIDYKVDAEGVANGLIDDFVVVGTEDAFKRTADTRDADNLAGNDRYEDAIGELEESRLGHFYVDVKPVFDAAVKNDPEAARNLEQFESLFPLDKLGPITGSFRADGDGMTLDTLVTGVPDGPFRRLAEMWSGGGTELLGELPGDAWGAFAIPKLGESARSLFSAFAGAIGGAAISGQVKQATGLDLERDIFSWVGDTGVFVRGADMASLDGALVISATDEAKAESAFGKLVAVVAKQTGLRLEPVKIEGADSAFALAPADAEKKVVLARGEGRVVAAYGERAARAALSPDAKLGDVEGFGDAKDILGGDLEPSFLLSVGDAIKLADGLGATDADFDKARPYLETLGVVTSGGKADGDRVQSRLAVTLK